MQFLVIAFICYIDFWWIVITCSVIGFIRGFIQIPLPLVIAEQYGPRFTTAFSLYMVVCGFLSLAIGVFSGKSVKSHREKNVYIIRQILFVGIVKDLTGSDLMVVHMLTILCILCAVPWSLEIFYKKMVKKS